jgi:uncharacterized protein YraI
MLVKSIGWLVVVATLVVSLVGIMPTPTAEATGCTGANWDGKFYNNTSLSGNPAATSCNGSIDFNWGQGSPLFGVHYDTFSARWTSVQTFPVAGTYTFTVTVDDGARLYINAVPIIDAFGESPLRTLSANYTVTTPGQALTLTFDYVEYTGHAQVKLQWALAGASPTPSGGTNPWTVEYYNNTSWAGAPGAAATAPGNGIASNWANNAPAVGFPVDNWSSRWTRVVDLPAGTYTFYLRADDGASVRLDNVEILNQAVYANGQTFTTSAALAAGQHTIQVYHYDVFDKANLFLTWTPAIGTTLLPDGCNGATAGINGSAPSCTGGTTTPPSGTAPNTVTVNTSVLNFRPAPSLNTTPLRTVLRGAQYTPVGRTADNAWIQYRVDGVLGWSVARLMILNGDINLLPISTSTTTPPTTPPSPTGVTARAKAYMKIRSGPGLQYPRIDGIPYGTIVNVLGRSGDGQWIQIQVGNTIGWSAAAYYELVAGNVNNIPITG